MCFRTIAFAALASAAVCIPRSFAGHCEDLLLHYSFDNFTSEFVEDLSGNDHHGTAFFSTAVPGVSGNALDFRTGGWVDAGNILDLGPDLPVITVVVWIKSYSVPFADFIIGKQQDFWPFRGWSLRMAPETRAEMVAIDRLDQVSAVDDVDIRDGEWHCVAGVFEASPALLKSSLYIDGQLQSTSEKIGPHAPLTTVAHLWLGRRYPGTIENYLGAVDEVRIFGRALSSAEIFSLADTPSFDPCAVEESKNWLSRIGFSNDPEGDQDVTEFYTEETFYVTVDDVQLNLLDVKKTKLELKQHVHDQDPKHNEAKTTFESGDDGLWRASVPLSSFEPGEIEVKVEIDAGKKRKIKRESSIYLQE